MQRTSTMHPALPRGSAIYDRMVEDARVATGAQVVVLTTWDPSTERIRTEASSGYSTVAAHRALKAARRLFASFDPANVELDVHVNPVQEAVFLRGESVSRPFMEVSAGVLPDVLLRIASKFLSLRESSVHPLLVQGKVSGSLSFHGNAVPAVQQRRAYQAFASQVSLALENAVLLGVLREQVQELRQTRRLVSAGNEAVRRELAETLHGPVQTQLLVADIHLRHALELVDEDPARAKVIIEEERNRIDDVRERDIREVSHILHPSVISLGLGAAMRSLAERYRPAMDVQVMVDPRLDGIASRTEVDLSLDARLAVYRVLEEALANARRHGNARVVSVTAGLSGPDRLTLEVVDDGVGFDSRALSKGLGLHMITMHVQEADGEWSIESEPDRGATLRAVFAFGPGSRPSEAEAAFASTAPAGRAAKGR